MIGKIRELMAVKEQVDLVIATQKDNSEIVKTLTQEISALKESMVSFAGKEKELLAGLEKDRAQIAEARQDICSVRDDLRKELYEFKLFKVETQKKILEKYDHELDRELLHHLDVLSNDAKHYNDMRLRVGAIAKSMDELTAEVTKLLAVSKKIDAADFSMDKFARQLMANDKEKLNLMQRIDGLERLISRIRKKQ